MADNSTLPGTGDVVAADEIAGVKFQRVKLIHGADGTNAGDVAAGNGLPVDTELTTADLNTSGGTDSKVAVGVLLATATGGVPLEGDSTNGAKAQVTTMPAAARTTDAVAAALQTDAVMNGLSALTPKFAKANVAASQTDSVVVTGVASKKIRVLEYRVHAGGTATDVTFNSKPAGAGTAISEKFACGANGGNLPGFSPVGHFETVAGEALTVTTGAGATTGIGVVYIEV